VVTGDHKVTALMDLAMILVYPMLAGQAAAI
jgi:hypothetical protein